MLVNVGWKGRWKTQPTGPSCGQNGQLVQLWRLVHSGPILVGTLTKRDNLTSRRDERRNPRWRMGSRWVVGSPWMYQCSSWLLGKPPSTYLLILIWNINSLQALIEFFIFLLLCFFFFTKLATTPPVVRYASGTNHKFHKEDLSRAIFCAQVVSQEDDARAEKFLVKSQQKHPDIQIEKIHMSLDYGDKHQKFLVAYANNATFIAFRGTKTLEDVTDTFQFDENCKRHFHKGFLKRSDVFDVGTRPHVPMFELLSKPGRRIILCGHAVGGAVSHMILLRFLLYYGESDRVSLH